MFVFEQIKKPLHFGVLQPMISTLSLITFFLRLTLVIQSQLIGQIPVDFSGEKVCLGIAAPDQKVHPVFNPESGNENALIESEKEEKSETESETHSEFLSSLIQSNFRFVGQSKVNPFFGSKALLGDQHLYDLFHSWKTHLS
jgi:hypothetical protein